MKTKFSKRCIHSRHAKKFHCGIVMGQTVTIEWCTKCGSWRERCLLNDRPVGLWQRPSNQIGDK